MQQRNPNTNWLFPALIALGGGIGLWLWWRSSRALAAEPRRRALPTDGEEPPQGEGGAEGPQEPPQGEGGAEEPQEPPQGEGGAEGPQEPPQGEGGAEGPQEPPQGEGGAEGPQEPPQGEGGGEEPQGTDDDGLGATTGTSPQPPPPDPQTPTIPLGFGGLSAGDQPPSPPSLDPEAIPSQLAPVGTDSLFDLLRGKADVLSDCSQYAFSDDFFGRLEEVAKEAFAADRFSIYGMPPATKDTHWAFIREALYEAAREKGPNVAECLAQEPWLDKLWGENPPDFSQTSSMLDVFREVGVWTMALNYDSPLKDYRADILKAVGSAVREQLQLEPRGVFVTPVLDTRTGGDGNEFGWNASRAYYVAEKLAALGYGWASGDVEFERLYPLFDDAARVFKFLGIADRPDAISRNNVKSVMEGIGFDPFFDFLLEYWGPDLWHVLVQIAKQS